MKTVLMTAALLLPGGSLIALAVWLTKRWRDHAAEATALDRLLAKKRAGLDAQLAVQGHDESKNVSAAVRRRTVAYHHRQAAAVAIGRTVDGRIRLVL